MTAAVVAPTIPGHAMVGMTLISPRIHAAPHPTVWDRTLLVVGDGPELAVALRDRLDRALVTVREVRPRESVDAVHACRPWPWMVIGDTPDVDGAFADALASRPVLLLWRSPPPPGLPPHLRVLRSFSALAEAVGAALSADVCGIRLAVGSGLTMAAGTHASSPALEALIANHPRPVHLSSRQLRAATGALSAYSVPLQVRRRSGGAVLVPIEPR